MGWLDSALFVPSRPFLAPRQAAPTIHKIKLDPQPNALDQKEASRTPIDASLDVVDRSPSDSLFSLSPPFPSLSTPTSLSFIQEFLDVYAKLRDELVADPLLGQQPEFASSYTRRMLDFNVPGGKLNRGLAVADAVAAIVSPLSTSSSVPEAVAALPTDARFKADALGWCIEWLQAFFLVADDIMDGSLTRRGQPCW